MNHDLPLGVIRVIGTDIGVKGAVVVEVNGEAVCALAPSEVTPHMNSLMGRMPVTIEFPDGHVLWTADAPSSEGRVSE